VSEKLNAAEKIAKKTGCPQKFVNNRHTFSFSVGLISYLLRFSRFMV